MQTTTTDLPQPSPDDECRTCKMNYEEGNHEKMIRPCNCNSWIHHKCLLEWVSRYGNKKNCEVCGCAYKGRETIFVDKTKSTHGPDLHPFSLLKRSLWYIPGAYFTFKGISGAISNYTDHPHVITYVLWMILFMSIEHEIDLWKDVKDHGFKNPSRIAIMIASWIFRPIVRVFFSVIDFRTSVEEKTRNEIVEIFDRDVDIPLS